MDYVLGTLSDEESGSLWTGGFGLSGERSENLDCCSSRRKLEVTEKGKDLAHYIPHVLKAYV